MKMFNKVTETKLDRLAAIEKVLLFTDESIKDDALKTLLDERDGLRESLVDVVTTDFVPFLNRLAVSGLIDVWTLGHVKSFLTTATVNESNQIFLYALPRGEEIKK